MISLSKLKPTGAVYGEPEQTLRDVLRKYYVGELVETANGGLSLKLADGSSIGNSRLFKDLLVRLRDDDYELDQIEQINELSKKYGLSYSDKKRGILFELLEHDYISELYLHNPRYGVGSTAIKTFKNVVKEIDKYGSGLCLVEDDVEVIKVVNGLKRPLYENGEAFEHLFKHLKPYRWYRQPLIRQLNEYSKQFAFDDLEAAKHGYLSSLLTDSIYSGFQIELLDDLKELEHTLLFEVGCLIVNSYDLKIISDSSETVLDLITELDSLDSHNKSLRDYELGVCYLDTFFKDLVSWLVTKRAPIEIKRDGGW